MFQGIQKARKDYKEETKNPPKEIESPPIELWDEIIDNGFYQLFYNK